MKVGIIQGRLSPPVEGKIQEFPKEKWKDEFVTLSKLELSHIEFIVTKNSFSEFINLSLDGYSKNISAICCDNIIDRDFHKEWFLNDNLMPICEIAKRDGISDINIPLLEESSLSDSNFQEFSKNILHISSKYPELRFNFEIESAVDISMNLVSLSDRFFFIYDTGNLNYIGVDHVEYIDKIFNKISHVHLKDRDINGSHFPGLGTTNFKLIFELLHRHNYDKYFTIQTRRGQPGDECNTISEHLCFFKTLWESQV